jgi:putative ABC transport system permease protein
MLASGIRKTLGQSGHPDNAIVIRKGSDAELGSNFEEPNVALILASPGVKHDPATSAPIGVGETMIVVSLAKKGTDGISNVQVRGVTEASFSFRPTVRITEGRAPRPGTGEVAVGKSLRGRFEGLELAQSFELRKNRPSTVVGIFEDGGSSFESEVWADNDAVRQAFGREGLVSSARVRLTSAADFDAFKAAVEQDKHLGFEAMRETAYYEKQSEGTSLFITALGSVIAVLFSAGAMIGAAITMYAAVAGRQREIGTMRALGFSRGSILLAFVLESFLLALLGGLVGALASVAMGLVKFSMMNFATWSEIVFTFDPAPWVLATSMCFAGMLGILGGFLPALRAARTSPVEAMRG